MRCNSGTSVEGIAIQAELIAVLCNPMNCRRTAQCNISRSLHCKTEAMQHYDCSIASAVQCSLVPLHHLHHHHCGDHHCIGTAQRSLVRLHQQGRLSSQQSHAGATSTCHRISTILTIADNNNNNTNKNINNNSLERTTISLLFSFSNSHHKQQQHSLSHPTIS